MNIRLRDFSVRKRLFLANFMMVAVPVCLLMLIGDLLLAALRFSGTAQQDILTALWPEKGSALTVQYAVSSLRVKAERKGPPKIKNFIEACRLLEALGIDVVVTQDDKIYYASPNANSTAVAERILHKYGSNPSVMVWDDEGFTFSYMSPRSRTVVMASGAVPFLAKDMIPGNDMKELWETALYALLAIAVILIVALGRYLSRLLSRQILEPLSSLQKAAAEIRKGNLDVPVEIEARDEFGRACQDFELMRQELKRSQDEREKYEKNRKELIAGISHDLSTPLTALKGYAGGILDGIANTPEKQRHYTEQIYQSADILESLVDSLFLFSKLDLGRVPFHLERVNIRDYFIDFTTEQRPFYAEKGLDLTLNTSGLKEDTFIQIDRMQFQRVIDNIFGNAVKYMDKTRGTMEISLYSRGERLFISFADNGPGVNETDLPKLFDSFYRTDPARSNVRKGSGLGLAIVRQIILAMNGTIRAESAAGGGLTIIIDLPLDKEH